MKMNAHLKLGKKKTQNTTELNSRKKSINYHKLENIQKNNIRFIIVNCLAYHSNTFFSKGSDAQSMITSLYILVRRELLV